MYKYPTETEIKNAVEFGWSKEKARRGFDIFDYDGTGLLAIEIIDDAHFDKPSDEDAAREAERIEFCKIIPIDELPNGFRVGGEDARWFVWVDTKENRNNIDRWVR